MRFLSSRLKAVEEKNNKKKADSNGDGDAPAPTVWDLARLRDGRQRNPEDLAAAARLPRFDIEKTYAGPVVAVDDARKEARVDLGGVQIVLPMRKRHVLGEAVQHSRVHPTPAFTEPGLESWGHRLGESHRAV